MSSCRAYGESQVKNCDAFHRWTLACVRIKQKLNNILKEYSSRISGKYLING
jgi:hypothetical protein